MPFYETIPTISNVIIEHVTCQVILQPEIFINILQKVP